MTLPAWTTSRRRSRSTAGIVLLSAASRSVRTGSSGWSSRVIGTSVVTNSTPSPVSARSVCRGSIAASASASSSNRFRRSRALTRIGSVHSDRAERSISTKKMPRWNGSSPIAATTSISLKATRGMILPQWSYWTEMGRLSPGAPAPAPPVLSGPWGRPVAVSGPWAFKAGCPRRRAGDGGGARESGVASPGPGRRDGCVIVERAFQAGC